MLAQFMNRELRRIEDVVRHGADRREQLSLERNGFQHGPVRIQRMRTSRFAESADQHGIGRFKKPQRHFEARVLLEFLVYGRKFTEGLPFADVDDHGDFGRFAFRFQDQFVKFAEKPSGRLSTQKKPRSSRARRNVPFPEPLSPVRMMKEDGCIRRILAHCLDYRH